MEKVPAKELKEKLFRQKRSAWEIWSAEEERSAWQLAEDYRQFLSRCKTEREVVSELSAAARAQGFLPWDGAPAQPARVKAGLRLARAWRGKALALVVVGERPLAEGWRLVAAHLDSPRLDLKPNPLYEEEGLALAKTHYYGGIKKYHWPALPLALHGVVYRADGKKVELVIGESEGEPCFTITDLLPHLAKKQAEKKLAEAVEGEQLNLVFGSRPYQGEEEVKDRVKLTILKLLHDRYGLVEEDFLSAELEAVPAGPAREVGWDQSLIGGYGQDDRVCAYTAWRAIAEVGRPQRTAVVLLVDKEEIGSMGNTGAQSRLLLQVLSDLSGASGPALEAILAAGQALSADVNAAFDPTYPDVVDKYNVARLGHGVVVTKYTGSGGKYSSNDAHAEFLAEVRRLFNEAGILWQTGELGRVDLGGGGTIAQFLANLGLNVVDCGVPVLSMHSPFEVTSKADIYWAYRAYRAFLAG